MRTVHGEEVDSMEEYLSGVLGNGDSGEPEYVDSVNGEGVATFGKRVFEWTSQGFEYVHRFESSEEAKAYAEEWHRDRFAPDYAFTTLRVCSVDLEDFTGEPGTVEYRNYPTACTVNIFYNGEEVDVYTLAEPVASFEDFETHCRDHFASSDFIPSDW